MTMYQRSCSCALNRDCMQLHEVLTTTVAHDGGMRLFPRANVQTQACVCYWSEKMRRNIRLKLPQPWSVRLEPACTARRLVFHEYAMSVDIPRLYHA
jgi:hypothetical protein